MNASTTATKTLPAIVVAGDVCIDWLFIPVAAASSDESRTNWRMTNGHHMYARHGGAWLTADFLQKANVDGVALRVISPDRRDDLESVAPEKIIHSLIRLGAGEDDDTKNTWMVKAFEGFAGPPKDSKPDIVTIKDDDPTASLVIIDDAGNGFRDIDQAHPAAIKADGGTPTVLYKVRSPLAAGKVWKLLSSRHLAKTIAVISADDLRQEGANISQGFSWERTATDIAVAIARDERFKELRRCSYCIITLGIEGALLIKCEKTDRVTLFYNPKTLERESVKGRMAGFGSAFAASVGCSIMSNPDLDTALRDGILRGLQTMKSLLASGFGNIKQPPQYPQDIIPSARKVEPSGIHTVDLPSFDPCSDHLATTRFRAWRILDDKRSRSLGLRTISTYRDLAQQVVIRGLEDVFPDIPIGKFGDLTLIDRAEIERFRTIRGQIQRFIKRQKAERPLSIAVFGPPGSGKSFGVEEVAKSAGKIEKMTFNLSQWDKPEYLAPALHQVRDHALRGNVPLVFFDEFDSKLDTELGWLKYFLAPMEDGVFADHMSTHQIGKAIFVFAGGTSTTFANFKKRGEDDPKLARDSKLPDFLSRIRGHVDICGFDPPSETNLFRRAVLLRFKLLKKCPGVLGPDKKVRIHPNVSRAFLEVVRYSHGARSMEAILDMCRLDDCNYFDPSRLPHKSQLDLHVDGRAFLTLANSDALTDDQLKLIARAAHENYLAEAMKAGNTGSSPALVPWDQLSDFYKNSNIEQAAYYPTLLAAAGCRIVATGGDPNFAFDKDQTDLLAQLEHQRWMEERREKQPFHPNMKPWEELDEPTQKKDHDAVNNIRNAINKAGLQIQRFS